MRFGERNQNSNRACRHYNDLALAASWPRMCAVPVADSANCLSSYSLGVGCNTEQDALPGFEAARYRIFSDMFNRATNGSFDAISETRLAWLGLSAAISSPEERRPMRTEATRRLWKAVRPTVVESIDGLGAFCGHFLNSRVSEEAP